VISQFGVEYSGLDALAKVSRLAARGGRIALLLHRAHGGIYRQCAASLDAIKMLQTPRLIPLTITMSEAEFVACRGKSSDAFQEAARKLSPALRIVESIMKKYRSVVADRAIVRLYKDVADIHCRLPNYEPFEVLKLIVRYE
jgi:hypothetical protein